MELVLLLLQSVVSDSLIYFFLFISPAYLVSSNVLVLSVSLGSEDPDVIGPDLFKFVHLLVPSPCPSTHPDFP